MALQGKRVYTLAEIANIDGISTKCAKTVLQRLKKNNILTSVYKNIWAIREASVYDAAYLIDPCCYSSAETALFYYNMIKQSSQVFHFVSKKISKKINTKYWTIKFHKIKNSLYFGFNDHIAVSEKALLDYLYFCIKDGRRPFVDIDITKTDIMDKNKLWEYSKLFPLSTQNYLRKLFSKSAS